LENIFDAQHALKRHGDEYKWNDVPETINNVEGYVCEWNAK
jgi:hypothetical protein